MKKLSLSLIGIVLSVVFSAAAYAVPNDSSLAEPGTSSSPKTGLHRAQVQANHSKAGSQLDERGKKRSDVKRRAAEMRKQLLRESGQQ